MKQISRLHFITTSAAIAEQACLGGVDWIQLRLKNTSYHDYYAIAKEVQAVCRQYGATFIVNDNVALALDIDADGVHIGKEDMPADQARALLGGRFIIGCTANTPEDVIRLSSRRVDYIGLGPFRFTATKEKLAPVLGLQGYRNIFNELEIKCSTYPPVIGIGGVTMEDVPSLLSTGLHGIAVSGAIASAANIAEAAMSFKRALPQQLHASTF